ncbi:MAG TPA: ABC transporter ATP-binding protein, partial [Burkholderiales bacterium]|nr:ABC transporter ATP-binding protein [Burkholderiales bacterium]
MAYGRGAAAVRAIDEVSLEIARGEFIAVVGPSGCGKSSLMRLISGLHPPLAGALTVEGKPVTGPLKSVGMAFQNSNLLPWRTAIENVLLPLEIVQPYRRDFSKQKYSAKARELLESVGLAGFTEKHPWELSGGMQQRASLCRALIHEPQLLMLDEPFGALDQFTREELWGVMQDLWITHRPTVLLVTHDLKEAAYLANRI